VRRRPILYLNISSLRTRGKIWRELNLEGLYAVDVWEDGGSLVK
jgi:hypothetical protein